MKRDRLREGGKETIKTKRKEERGGTYGNPRQRRALEKEKKKNKGIFPNDAGPIRTDAS